MTDAVQSQPLPRRILAIAGLVLLWGWSLLNMIGGAGLLMQQGPWPLTNGWFAFCGGLSACPATAWIVRRLTGVRIPMWVQFTLAFAWFLAGRIALAVTGRGHFLPTLTS